jgi:uncharacterized protein with FMN-binding domain
MKRAPIVLSGTALGLAGVLSYHTASSPSKLVSSSSSSVKQITTKTATSTSTSTATSSSSQKRSATGDDVSFQYGDLQVKVTASGSRITDVSVVQMNVSDPHSQSIDQFAVPELRQEALSAQGASIDGVSGASYTSQAYEQSLQSALDKLGVSSSAQ